MRSLPHRPEESLPLQFSFRGDDVHRDHLVQRRRRTGGVQTVDPELLDRPFGGLAADVILEAADTRDPLGPLQRVLGFSRGPLSHDAARSLLESAQAAGDSPVPVAHRGVAEREVRVLHVSTAIDGEAHVLEEEGLTPVQHGGKDRLFDRPHLRPRLPRRASERVGVLPGRDDPVCVVIYEKQFGPYQERHGEDVLDDQAHCRAEPRRPLAPRAKRCATPVPAADEAAQFTPADQPFGGQDRLGRDRGASRGSRRLLLLLCQAGAPSARCSRPSGSSWRNVQPAMRSGPFRGIDTATVAR